MNLLDRLIEQLDTLVPFLALASRDGFELIASHAPGWLSEGEQAAIPDTFEHYQTQVAHSAFLLGYSYCEAFLADLAKEVYRNRPKMLPAAKSLKYSEVLACRSREEILQRMIEKEVGEVFYKSLDEVGAYLRTKMSLPWEDAGGQILRASLVRNCIIHNLAKVDDRLANASDWSVGDRIALSTGDVHDFGIAARELATSLYRDAERRHFYDPVGSSDPSQEADS